MATEGPQAKSTAPAPPPLPVSEKRVVAEDGREEERPETKRRRACVAALHSVPCAAPADGEREKEGHRDGSSFSFQHARGGFVALETTPKFGSFNPPAAAEQEALDQNPAPPAREDSPRQEEDDAASARGDCEDKDGNSQSGDPPPVGDRIIRASDAEVNDDFGVNT